MAITAPDGAKKTNVNNTGVFSFKIRNLLLYLRKTEMKTHATPNQDQSSFVVCCIGSFETF